MISHQDIYSNSMGFLKEAGYDVFVNIYSGMEMCFEIIARHKSKSEYAPNLLIKIIENIDSIKPHIVNEIKLVSRLMAAIPLLIAVKNRHTLLEDDSIYIRKDLIAINLYTFHKIIQSPQIPMALAFAKKGGLFFDVNGEKLSDLRKKHNLSRKSLAEKIDLSPKAISQYELKNMRTSINHANKMELLFGESVIEPLDFFKFLKNSMRAFKLDSALQKRISSKTREFMGEINEIVNDAGYQVFWPRTSPFDLFVYQEDEEGRDIADYTFVGGTQCDRIFASPRHEAQKEFIQHVPRQNSSGVVYDENIYDEEIAKQNAVPYILPKEFKELEHPDQFKKLIKKRRNSTQKSQDHSL
ncbi:helix-turn-helix domain-containing protein [Candidatus Lokiarchaeum ossiferum]|uniref:helix-turn-helix domain-containing protein n=1 Tax=Candidatus Lokiarchaeum ossiferum TaxID=2951803 RepID=UPI00352BFC63